METIHHPTEKKHIRFSPRLFLPFFGVIVLVLTGIIWMASIETTAQNAQRRTTVDLPSVTPTPTIYDDPNTVVLRRKTNNGRDTITSAYIYSVQPVRWGDYIYYGSTGYNEDVVLARLDLTSDTEKIIFRQPGRIQYINDLQVINNTLFFTIGGYLAPGAIYWYDLSSEMIPQKIRDIRNARIELIGNRYWVVGGEGDGCGGESEYYTFDVTARTVQHVADVQHGCLEGDEFVGFDTNNRLIVADHTLADISPYPPMRSLHHSITAISIDNPTQRTTLISKDIMPPDIITIRLDNNTNALYLQSLDIAYRFSLTTNTLETLPEKPATETQTNYPSSPSSREAFEKLKKELNLPATYSLTLE